MDMPRPLGLSEMPALQSRRFKSCTNHLGVLVGSVSCARVPQYSRESLTLKASHTQSP